MELGSFNNLLNFNIVLTGIGRILYLKIFYSIILLTHSCFSKYFLFCVFLDLMLRKPPTFQSQKPQVPVSKGFDRDFGVTFPST